MRPFRVAAILIGIMVMTHSGVMSIGLHELNASDYEHAHHAMANRVCDETEGVSSATRIPLDPSAFSVLAHESGTRVSAAGDAQLAGWTEPIVTASVLRTLLQVFLN